MWAGAGRQSLHPPAQTKAMAAYYNEIDPYAAEWLRTLIAFGNLPAGDVDTRSIVEVQASDLVGYDQCHFFAGVGGWPLALRYAGWPDDRPVWTGSCPCQPFSAAGKRKGVEDERHLWPEFRRLVAECNPAVVFGEQVASKDGRLWLAGVRSDLEALGYAVGAADLCAAGVGVQYEEAPAFEWLQWAISSCPDPALRDELAAFAEWAGREIVFSAPHIRQRLWWVADSVQPGRAERWTVAGSRQASGLCGVSGLANTDGRDAGAEGLQRGGQHGQQPQDGGVGRLANVRGAGDSGLGDAGTERRERREDASRSVGEGAAERGQGVRDVERASVDGFWSDFDLIPCTDGKARRIEPGTFPLAHGIPNRVGRLRAYGNAINPWLAAEFVQACDEALTCL